MKNFYYFIIGILLFIFLYLYFGGFIKKEISKQEIIFQDKQKKEIILPKPNLKGNSSLEEIFQKRRSIRDYKNKPLTLNDVSQILWASQGITQGNHRTVPSAGALYPIEIFLTIKNVQGLEKGIYHYIPKDHKLILIKEGDFSEDLSDAALSQQCVKDSALNLIITGVFERTTQKYGERAIRYVWMEAGHSAQNIYLEAGALNLGTVSVGVFEDEKVKRILNLPKTIDPLYIMPIGKPK